MVTFLRVWLLIVKVQLPGCFMNEDTRCYVYGSENRTYCRSHHYHVQGRPNHVLSTLVGLPNSLSIYKHCSRKRSTLLFVRLLISIKKPCHLSESRLPFFFGKCQQNNHLRIWVDLKDPTRMHVFFVDRLICIDLTKRYAYHTRGIYMSLCVYEAMQTVNH